MVIKSVMLETVCGITSTLPLHHIPEVAFAGKSNVGKSSLLNGLIHRNSYARTSQSPGKTQTINYYLINESFYYVDLPGYGYAKVSKEIKAKWGKMIETYLHTSPSLRCVFLLVDIRHDPSENDKLMYRWICDQGFNPVVIATKADKISRSKKKQAIERIGKVLEVLPDTLIYPYSALTKEGREEIEELIQYIVEHVPNREMQKEEAE